MSRSKKFLEISGWVGMSWDYSQAWGTANSEVRAHVMSVSMESSGATETRQNEQKCLQFKQNTWGHCQSSDAAALSILKQLSTTWRKYTIRCRIIKAGGIGWGSSEMCYSSSNLLGNNTWEETVGTICSRNVFWIFKPILKTFKVMARSPLSRTRLIVARDQIMWQSEDVCFGDMLISYSTWWSPGPLYPVAKAKAKVKNLRSSQTKTNNQRPHEDNTQFN